MGMNLLSAVCRPQVHKICGVPEADVLDDVLHLLHGGDPVAGPVKSHVRKGNRLRKNVNQTMVNNKKQE